MIGHKASKKRWGATFPLDTEFLLSDFFGRDQDNNPVLDADDYTLLEHVREHGDVAAGTLGWIAPVEAGVFHVGRPGWQLPDLTRPRYYEPHWRRAERTRRRNAKKALVAHRKLLARQRYIAERAKAREEARLRALEREMAAVQQRSAAQEAAIAEREKLEAVLDLRNTRRLADIAYAERVTRERVESTKRAILAMMRNTYPTVWTAEQLAAAVGCPDPDFVRQCCDEMVRDGVIGG